MSALHAAVLALLRREAAEIAQEHGSADPDAMALREIARTVDAEARGREVDWGPDVGRERTAEPARG